MSKISDKFEADNRLEKLCRLDFGGQSPSRRLVGTICTIGTATRNENVVKKLIMEGMNIVRLNLSYESHEHHAQTVETIRAVADECSKELGYIVNIGFALDTKGPEIRTGIIDNNGEIELMKGDNFRLSVNKDLIDKGNKEVVYVDYRNIINVAVPGDLVYLSNGAVSLIVKEVAVDCLICEILSGGILGSKKDVALLTDNPLDLPPVSEKDRYDIKFAIDYNIDMIFASKIRNPNAIKEIRSILGEKGKNIKVLAKIENRQILPYMDEVISMSDGVILGRSDLAVEIPIQNVPLIQKALISRCNKAGKPIVLATGILETMRFRNRATLSEVADVNNALVDGVDCLMLSSETAVGDYPVESLQMLISICREAERVTWHRDYFADLIADNPAMIDASHAVAISAVDASKKSRASAIVCLTTSGITAHMLSKYKPQCVILAVTRCSRTARQLQLYRSVVPILFTDKPKEDWLQDVDMRVQYALLVAKKMDYVQMGDSIVIVSPWNAGTGFANNVRIVYAFFQRESVKCLLKGDLNQ